MSKSPQGAESAIPPAIALRKQAEEIFRGKAARLPEDLTAMSPEEARQTLQELRVHQIELEMQNEKLRRVQAELDAALACYFELYDLAPVGYCTVSEKGLIIEANLTAAILLGTARSALIMQPLSRFIHKEDQDIFYLHRKQLLETYSALRRGSVQASSLLGQGFPLREAASAGQAGEPAGQAGAPAGQAGAPHAFELRMVEKGGTIFWARLEANVARDAGGVPVSRVVLTDITERKRAEDQIRQLQKTESLGRMAGAIAHHFNNQLGVVIGNLELALIHLSGDSGSRNNLLDAMKATRRSAEISGLMLTYLGQTIGQWEPLALSEVCCRNLPMLQATLPKDVVLETDLPSPGPIVSTNANQIRQVLTNLVTNAWEAMSAVGGAVHVTVKTVSADTIPALHRFPIDWQPQDKAHACLEVRDTGCGIAEQDIDKLFDPFFSNKFTGRGLGLSVVLGFARAHDGAITVESKPGRGSVFRVFMPLSADGAPRRPDQADQASEI